MLINNDCLIALDELEKNSVDAIVTDPPYELNFMSKGWDNAGVSFNKETWAKCLRVLKPGGYLLAFGGSRTYHRIACAIEDAGFEIRDCIMWLYGSGFPKNMNIGLAIDKKNGVKSKTVGSGRCGKTAKHGGLRDMDTNDGNYEIKEAQNKWAGWGTALKPSYEPIVVARKPLEGSCVANVMKWGVGGLNIDECRIAYQDDADMASATPQGKCTSSFVGGAVPNINSIGRKDFERPELKGRFPANTILTYGEADYKEVCGGFPNSKGGSGKGFRKDAYEERPTATNFTRGDFVPYNDDGSAARYFYCAKASKKDRDEGLEEFEEYTTDDGRKKPIDNPYLRGGL
jgi:site-specific DNA-methyltransferase (adenine-specific)